MMNASLIARTVWSSAKRLLVWFVQISICIVFIAVASMISAEYARNSAFESCRFKQRQMSAYAKTGRHMPRAAGIHEIHVASLAATVAYMTDSTQCFDCTDPSSYCNSLVMSLVTLWVEHQSSLAWFLLVAVCVYLLAARCPIADIHLGISSDLAVHKFLSSVQMEQGGRDMK